MRRSWCALLVSLSLVGLVLGSAMAAEKQAAHPSKVKSPLDKAGKEKPRPPYVPGEAVKRIETALRSPTEMEFVDTPLAEIVDYLKDLHQIEIQRDSKSLAEVGVGCDAPITCNLKGLSLASALHLILTGMDLTYIIRDEVLLITTKDVADNWTFLKVYPVEDLVATTGKNPPDYDSLALVITNSFRPSSWNCLGGNGSMAEIPQRGAWSVRQTAEIHDQLADLLDLLRKAKAMKRGPGQPPDQPSLIAQNRDRLEKALDSAVCMEFVDTPLQDVVPYLKDLHHIEIQLDRKALDELGIAPDTPVTKAVKGVSLRSALRLLLGELDLTYMIEGEVLLITSKDRADQALEMAVYPVADLVLPGDGSSRDPDFDSLIDACTATVQPTSWDNVGGAGTIGRWENGLCLVVSQTQDVHREIGQLLAELRNLPVSKLPPPKPRACQAGTILSSDPPPCKPEVKK